MDLLNRADLAAQAAYLNRRLHAEGFYAMEYPEPLPEGGYPYAHGSFTFATQIAKGFDKLQGHHSRNSQNDYFSVGDRI